MKLKEFLLKAEPTQKVKIWATSVKEVAAGDAGQLLDGIGWNSSFSKGELFDSEIKTFVINNSEINIDLLILPQQTRILSHGEFENFLLESNHVKIWAVEKLFTLYKDSQNSQNELIAKESYKELEELLNEIGITNHPFIEETLDYLMKNIELIHGWEVIENDN